MAATKAKIIINEQHTLVRGQQDILNDKYGIDRWELHLVPASGWTLAEQKKQESTLLAHPGDVIFASPVPFLLASLAYRRGRNIEMSAGTQLTIKGSVSLLHNDRREKKELPNGKVISVVAQEGWKIVTF